VSISIDKLVRVLNSIAVFEGVATVHGMVTATAGGEIAIDFTSQLTRSAHAYLINKGFVQGGAPANATSYVYRP